jgi:RNA polymerase sigma-70 factor (ECF subfamily)
LRVQEDALIAAARHGDEEAFRRLVDPLRPQLHAQCCRMLGSPHDAEDAVQESLLRAWRALPRFDGRAAVSSWLYRIAANVCLTTLGKRTHPAPIDEDEPVSAGPGYDTYDAVAHAMSATLNLPANQRAALILRDVLGFAARDAASTLGTTAASVNSALQRARANIENGDRLVDDERVRDAVEAFVAAFESGDVDALIGIAADTTLSADRSWAYSPVPAY